MDKKDYRWHYIKKESDFPVEDDQLFLVSLNGMFNQFTFKHVPSTAYWVKEDRAFLSGIDDEDITCIVEAWRYVNSFDDKCRIVFNTHLRTGKSGKTNEVRKGTGWACSRCNNVISRSYPKSYLFCPYCGEEFEVNDEID